MQKSKLAMGATGVALAAGAMVVGMALSNKETRRSLQKGAKSTIKKFNEIRDDLQKDNQERFQTVQHRVGRAIRRVSSKASHRRGRSK